MPHETETVNEMLARSLFSVLLSVKLEFILLNRQRKLHFILILRAGPFKSHLCIQRQRIGVFFIAGQRNSARIAKRLLPDVVKDEPERRLPISFAILFDRCCCFILFCV